LSRQSPTSFRVWPKTTLHLVGGESAGRMPALPGKRLLLGGQHLAPLEGDKRCDRLENFVRFSGRFRKDDAYHQQLEQLTHAGNQQHTRKGIKI
jgi:hypothetical protein